MQAIKSLELLSLIIFAFYPTVSRVINAQSALPVAGPVAPLLPNNNANQRGPNIVEMAAAALAPVQQSATILDQQHQQQPSGQVGPTRTSTTNQLSNLELLHKSHQQLSQLLLSGRNSPLVAQAANLTLAGSRYANNVFDIIKDVGKSVLASASATAANQQASNTKNQYQLIAPQTIQAPPARINESQVAQDSVIVGENQHLTISGAGPISSSNEAQASKYREQGELLRQEIVVRVGQLQQVIANSMGAVKNNGDLIMRRLFDMLHKRLDDARQKADRVISEPTNNELAVRALSSVNNGLRNLNSVITGLVSRVEAASAANAANGVQPTPLFGASAVANTTSGESLRNQLMDPNKLQANLLQLKQQFSSAFSAIQQQQKQLQQQQQAVKLQDTGNQQIQARP